MIKLKELIAEPFYKIHHKILELCSKPRKLFEKSLAKTFNAKTHVFAKAKEKVFH